jgi:Serine phosphatase RsbU, regulator of sigma subunit
MHVLVADDDPIMRKLLWLNLAELGHKTTVAEDGIEALDIFDRDSEIELVISDWMMPGMTGIELCRRIRALPRANYIHVLLLTARQTRDDFLEAMEAGADDFLSKPLDATMLTARLRAAERVLMLQSDLRQNNQLLSAANQKLSTAYEQLRGDMEAAARLQKSLLPKPCVRLGRVQFANALFPSASVSGDVYNFFELADGSIAMYAVDVAGHGARAALMSVTLSRVLTAEAFQDASHRPRMPDTLIADLNQRFQANHPNLDYFTMIGAILSPDGAFRFCQAGHPHPVVIPAAPDLEPYLVGTGGFPVALIDYAAFCCSEVALYKGDRLVLYSDGVTESATMDGTLYGEDRFKAFLAERRRLPLDQLMEAVRAELVAWQGSDEFRDDVSLLAFELLN